MVSSIICSYWDTFRSKPLNTGLVSSGASLTSWGERETWLTTLLVMVSRLKLFMGYTFYIDQLRIPSFPIGLVKNESGFTVRSVETGLER